MNFKLPSAKARPSLSGIGLFAVGPLASPRLLSSRGGIPPGSGEHDLDGHTPLPEHSSVPVPSELGALSYLLVFPPGPPAGRGVAFLVSIKSLEGVPSCGRGRTSGRGTWLGVARTFNSLAIEKCVLPHQLFQGSSSGLVIQTHDLAEENTYTKIPRRPRAEVNQVLMFPSGVSFRCSLLVFPPGVSS